MRIFRYFPLALVILTVCAAPAAAAPTDLDPTFGVGGKVDLGSVAEEGSVPIDTTADGKILMAYDAPANQAVVRRFNADGSVDTTFGASGAMLLPVEPGATNPRVSDIVEAPNGRIWVGGVQDFAGEDNASVWAVTAGGTPDTGFNGDGVHSFAPGTASSEVVGIAPEGDNLILAARAVNGTTGVALYRVFAGGGSATALHTFAVDFEPEGVALRPDGSIMVGGELDTGTATFMAVPRFTTALGYDGTFGLGGYGIIGPPIPAESNATAVVIDGNNNTYAFGMYAYTAALGGLTPPGAPIDGGVGVSRIQQGGFASFLFDGSRAASGNFYAIGVSLATSGETPSAYRFRPDISPDPGFGTGGQFALPTSGNVDAMSQTLQADGRYLIGYRYENDGIQLHRLLGDYTPPAPAAPVVPTAKFGSSVKSKSKASKFKKLRGTAAGTSITRVEVAIQRVDKKLLKKSKRCLFVKSTKGSLTKVKSVKGKCSKPKWLKARGTTAWSYTLKRALKPGSYVLSVRATGAGGVSKTVTKRVRLSK